MSRPMAIEGKSEKVREWLKAMGIDVPLTYRVIIDINVRGAVCVYTSHYLDRAALGVSFPGDLGPQITYCEKEEQSNE